MNPDSPPSHSRHPGRPGPGNRPAQTEFEARAESISRQIAALVRDLWQFRHAGSGASRDAPAAELDVRLVFGGAGGGEAKGARLVREILAAMEDLGPRDGLKEGRVHCFLCQSTACAHAVPPDRRSVFTGYGTNGKPEWGEMSNVLLRAGDSRVDLLFSESPVILARAQRGDELRAHQLHDFGRNSSIHRVLGQVIAGYFPGPDAGTPRNRWAMTLQAVEYRDGDGMPRVGLNVISEALGTSGMTGILAMVHQEALYTTVAHASVQVTSISRRAVHPARRQWRNRGFEDQVHDVLRDLARHLERESCQRQSRTRHVREERTRSDRPVAAARRDAESARPDNVYFDESQSTLIVVGPRRRAHVFNPQGKLVTSINYEGDEIGRKIRTRQWRPATPEEIALLRHAVRSFSTDRP